MKLKDYLKNANAMVKKFPQTLEMELIYAADDEGNDYHPVIGDMLPVMADSPTDRYVQIKKITDWIKTSVLIDHNAILVN